MTHTTLLCRFALPLLLCGSLVSLPLMASAHAPAAGAATHHHDDGHGHDDNDGDNHAHDDDHDGEHDREQSHDHDDGVVELSPRQQMLAGIRAEVLTPRALEYPLRAPAEIRSNDYTSYMVSPRVPSVILRRHVTLGDHVKAGQPLVTLFSEDVASAQAAYRLALSEQQRVNQLGRAAVGERRFVEAGTALAAARGRLQAYGLDDEAIRSLGRDDQPLGEYTLTARRDGAVLSDHFRQGQRADAGMALIELADESRLWVEVYLSPGTPADLPTGMAAQVRVGQITLPGTVIQQAHTIDPVSRTRIVRLDIDNSEHLLHPGMFAEVNFLFRTDTPVLAVPETALLRNAEGEWQLFEEHQSGHYRARDVTPGRSLGLQREITGIEPGTRVVMQGAFFIASEIAKGGFDPHNH